MQFFTIPLILMLLNGLTQVAGAPSLADDAADLNLVRRAGHGSGRTCGTHISAARKAAHELKFAAARKHASATVLSRPVINVHFHVITANSTYAGGSLSDAAIKKQMAVLNRDFKRSGIHYHLANTTRIINKSWFANVSADSLEQTNMKQALRQGGADTLNVYTVGFANTVSAGLLGYATFPADYQGLPKDDGVVINYRTLPGGSVAHFNKGRTLTHEIGHWVGLYHTFQGASCTSSGDMVTDTPAQKTPTSGCPKRAPDTCPGKLGRDPIHNFMDYSDDACMTQFSTGQISRLRAQLRTYRNVNV